MLDTGMRNNTVATHTASLTAKDKNTSFTNIVTLSSQQLDQMLSPPCDESKKADKTPLKKKRTR